MDGRVMQQIPISSNDKKKIKEIAIEQNKYLYELIDEILTWFFLQASKRKLYILASTQKKGNPYWSLWIRPADVKKIAQHSKKEGCSGNRVIYSALMHWLDQYASI